MFVLKFTNYLFLQNILTKLNEVIKFINLKLIIICRITFVKLHRLSLNIENIIILIEVPLIYLKLKIIIILINNIINSSSIISNICIIDLLF